MSKTPYPWAKNTDEFYNALYCYIKCGFLTSVNLFFSNEDGDLSNIYKIFESFKAECK